MSVDAGYELAGHMKRTNVVVFVTAGRTKTAMATERNKLERATMRTAIHGSAVRRVTTMNHPGDIIHDSRTRVEFILNMFKIISKNSLQDIHKNILQ